MAILVYERVTFFSGGATCYKKPSWSVGRLKNPPLNSSDLIQPRKLTRLQKGEISTNHQFLGSMLVFWGVPLWWDVQHQKLVRLFR